MLRAADGLQDRQIAEELNITPEKAARWRTRFLDGGIPALQKDAPRPGRTRTITDTKVKRVIDMTTQDKPDNATHWSTRTMAAAAGLSETSVRRIWHAHGLIGNRMNIVRILARVVHCEHTRTLGGVELHEPVQFEPPPPLPPPVNTFWRPANSGAPAWSPPELPPHQGALCAGFTIIPL